jgi:hypothetical protein
MKIHVSESVPLSADEVFHLLRDDMPKLVPYLYDVERIDVVERREDGDRTHIVNLWFGDMSKVPGPVRPFVKPELISWKDHATWTTSSKTATWRLEPRIGARAFDCNGTTRILSNSASATLAMDIDLEIHPENVPGVPRLLANRFRGQIEEAIAKQITPNLKNLAVSIRRYAEARGKG